MALVKRPPLPPGPYLVAGLGRAGEAAISALARIAGPQAISACDEHQIEQLRHVRERLRADGIRIAIGDLAAALDADPVPACVVKSPGIHPDAALVGAAERRGIPVLDELEVGWRLARAPVIGITGTSGKSTVAHLVGRCLEAAGLETVVTGNFDQGAPYSRVDDPVEGWTVCEVSSYQLAGCPAFLPEIGVFTNLTRDHLRRHGGWHRYAACKRRMFVRGDRCVGAAVLNTDDPFGRELATEVAARGGRVISYGTGPVADYRVKAKGWTMRSGEGEIRGPDDSVAVESRLPGSHNALNLAAALAVADAIGIARDAALGALATAPGLPGRFERIDEGQGFEAVVDFAHSPDAARKVLETAREVARRRQTRLIVAMGAAGQMDPGKRAAMGRTATDLADVAIFTASSTWGEPATSIMAGLLEGARTRPGTDLMVEPDRRKAIALAVDAAKHGDVLLLLGRGPLQLLVGTDDGDGVPFDDREVLREALSGLGADRLDGELGGLRR
jgi:UDP-N-acetylmuramoyl-L-alanyl-D-glutamate--2,6-diaminopimelate ligase